MAPSHMDVRLDWLITGSGIEQADAFRRLNAIENQITNLASQWRPARPIDPARELRFSEATREALMEWVVNRHPVHGAIMKRLAIYCSPTVRDALVPDGWLRLTLEAEADLAQKLGEV